MKKIFYFFNYLLIKVTKKFYYLGFPVAFSAGLTIKNSRFLSIAKQVFIGPDCLIQVPDEYLDEFKIKDQPIIQIAENVTIGYGTWITANKKVKIGKNVLIAPLCFIADHRHAYSNPLVPIKLQGLTVAKKVIIKDGAWIGTKVTISPGVVIGKNSVIGANSVVTSDVPDHSVAVGIPAKVIKSYDFNQQKWVKQK